MGHLEKATWFPPSALGMLALEHKQHVPPQPPDYHAGGAKPSYAQPSSHPCTKVPDM